MKKYIKQIKKGLRKNIINNKREFSISEITANSFLLDNNKLCVSKKDIKNLGDIVNDKFILDRTYVIIDNSICPIVYKAIKIMFKKKMFKKLIVSKVDYTRFIIKSLHRYSISTDIDYIANSLLRDLYLQETLISKNIYFKEIRRKLDTNENLIIEMLNSDCTVEDKELYINTITTSNINSFLSSMSLVSDNNLKIIQRSGHKIIKQMKKDNCISFKDYLNSFIKYV